MRYNFNPLTADLELVADVSFFKKYVDVDAAFLSTRDIDLENEIITDSERVYVNGLIVKDDCYTISTTILTIDAGLNIAVGDELDVRYAVQ